MRTVLTCFLLSFTFACSDAETPQAFDAGLPDINTDGGATGIRDTPCFADNTCEDQTLLVCVEDGESLCRLVCLEGGEDPCGERQSCDLLNDETRACLPD